MSVSRQLSFASVALLLPAVVLTAADKLDLARVLPVPAGQPIPIQDFFRPAALSDPQLNATGTFLAASVDLGDRSALLVCNMNGMKIDVLRGSANKDLYATAWLDQNHLLTSWSADRLYADGLYVTDAANLKDNYAVENFSATALIGVPRTTPTLPLIWISRNAYDEGKDMGVVQIDTRERLGANRDALPGSMQAEARDEQTSLYGTKATITRSFPAPDGGVVVNYLADKDGELAFAITSKQGVFALHRFEKKKWLKCPVDLDLIDVVGVGDRPFELFVIGPRTEGKPRVLQRLDAVSGELGQVMLQDKAYDPGDCGLYRQPKTGLVLGVRFRRGRFVSAWFDESYRSVQEMINARFPGHVTRIIGSDDAEQHFLISTYSDREPIAYYSVDLAKHSVGLIKAANPWIDPARMQLMNVMKFKTRDGHELEAYVTLPAGAARDHPAPLVVLPHGGPWARDTWGFDAEAQFLASRGYAVLQPNYRGSTGYDWMFSNADLWAFRKMHDDVTDAVRTLQRTGLVDAKRMAIMGTSFGGYLALCGAAFEPDLYRCAVTISGVFDWEQVMRESKYDQYTSAKFGILRRNLGDPASQAAGFAAIAPLRSVNQVRIPVFVSHGKEDSVADVGESRSLIAALEKFRVPHESMLVAGEGHGMSFLKNQVELYSRIEAFLAKNLAPIGAATGASGGP